MRRLGSLERIRGCGLNIEIMRVFIRVRRVLASNIELAGTLEALETKYDTQFEVVFEAIRDSMTPRVVSLKGIGFWPVSPA